MSHQTEPAKPPASDGTRRPWLARLRDQTDLRGGLVSIAIGAMFMELVSQVVGPVPPALAGLGALAIAAAALFWLVPLLRRGDWRR